MSKLYYTAPSEEIFNEVKKASMELWTEIYPEEYAKGKVGEIEPLQNIQDNVMSIVARFDQQNMELLANTLSPEARTALRERMIDGGNPPEYIAF